MTNKFLADFTMADPTIGTNAEVIKANQLHVLQKRGLGDTGVLILPFGGTFKIHGGVMLWFLCSDLRPDEGEEEKEEEGA